MRRYFITGVGTEVGKTLVTTILCHQLTAAGRSVCALKPVVSGYSDDDRETDPALILRSLGRSPSVEAIAAMAPWRFAAPLSPHLAARREHRSIEVDEIVAFCRAHEEGDVLIVEGAGGIMSPIDSRKTGLDVILALGYPVILVTGSYLGALSHTLTALYTLRASGAGLAGIVVSESAESAGLAETVESLEPYAGSRVPLYALPRLPGGHETKWRTAPVLTGLGGEAVE